MLMDVSEGNDYYDHLRHQLAKGADKCEEIMSSCWYDGQMEPMCLALLKE